MKIPELIPDWKHAWKWVSMNCMAVALAIQGTWLSIPEDMRDHLPNHIASISTAILLILGIAGRLVQQPKPKKRGKK